MSFGNINIPNNGLTGEMIMSLVVMAIMLILCIVIAIASRKTDPFKKPKGIMFLAEFYVDFIDNMVVNNMGPQFKKIAPYFGFLCMYIFLCFIIGMLGFPAPLTYYLIPFILALISFLAIHITSMIYTKFKYFKRFIEPLPFFLPINMLSMWSPLLSLSFRLFCNALSGWILMGLLYDALMGLSNMIFKLPFFIAPVVAPILHAYFDVFSGFIQTTVFVFLTMLFVSNEVPEGYIYKQQTVKNLA